MENIGNRRAKDVTVSEVQGQAENNLASQAFGDSPQVRPYGFAGLILSFIGICLLGAALMGVGAALWMAIAGVDAVVGSINALAGVDINAIKNASHGVQMTFYAVTAASFIAFGLATLAFARWRGGRDWRTVLAWREPTGWPSGRGLWLLVGLALVYLVVVGFGIKLVYPQFRTWFFVPADAAGMALSFVAVVILAPWAEELIFRGWIYSSLRQSFGPWPAIVVTAAVFAVVHMDPSRLYPLLIFIPGLMLTIIREKNGSTKASFYAHALYNGLAWLIVLLVGNP